MTNGKEEAINVTGHIPAFDPAEKPPRNKYALACSLLASLASILLGYDIGVMSGAVMYIKDDLEITDVQVEILAGILNVFSLVGSAAAGRTSDWIGRRYTMVVASVIFFVGAILMGFATNYAFLLAGRFVAGVGVGYALMIAPVYTAEGDGAAAGGATLAEVTAAELVAVQQADRRHTRLRPTQRMEGVSSINRIYLLSQPINGMHLWDS
ncbi:unnamed protein product [Cuscuta campestris]|uniref:Major facilitator superfamily (MFS) profile domain-containing protein n=1 Tax=Cuscuta campestris TaxID=132261 RepID=A0A484L167_9ASTE|nr:unnamed protein product [Cuscuta campestris]